jgi:hypothetical protein
LYKVSFGDGEVTYYSCASVCWPSDLSICSTGALSNKLGPLCLFGNLDKGSDKAYPFACEIYEACGVSIYDFKNFFKAKLHNFILKIVVFRCKWCSVWRLRG